jgi:small subunit ribosomal protein S16
MLKIRLMRIGAKGRPFYRIVVVDERKKRTGSYLELLGTYNPLTTPKEIKLNQAKVDEWVKKGAQLSDGFLRITKQKTQIEPRKVRNPGKLRSNTPAKEEAPVAEAPVAEAAEVEETTTDAEATPEVEVNASPEVEVNASPEVEVETVTTEEVATPEEETTVDESAEASTDTSSSNGSEEEKAS